MESFGREKGARDSVLGTEKCSSMPLWPLPCCRRRCRVLVPTKDMHKVLYSTLGPPVYRSYTDRHSCAIPQTGFNLQTAYTYTSKRTTLYIRFTSKPTQTNQPFPPSPLHALLSMTACRTSLCYVHLWAPMHPIEGPGQAQCTLFPHPPSVPT